MEPFASTKAARHAHDGKQSDTRVSFDRSGGSDRTAEVPPTADELVAKREPRECQKQKEPLDNASGSDAHLA
jgi:hypothetical protein